MSERYGACRSCKGHGKLAICGEVVECGICGGTGFSGDAMDYVDPSYALRIGSKRDKPNRLTPKEALDIAVQAALTFNKKTVRHGR